MYNVTLRRICLTSCRVKAACITFSKRVGCLSYPVCKAHAPYYIVICGMSGSTVVFHIISQKTQFSKEKKSF